ncbi:16S rRNA (cytosine(1402)-N(4))-methyltransferase [Candidatus Woesebacteria bacterium RBG_19FT_COMBO_42_9]|uniref:Ribosomal RNA small subunit methyltransferase H n=1 Tax=Candidatus Woesebacteria bacterium RBG_16_42_24 TaxID=1802485 RepID=A0A1F7XL83_9BACT|nr:MAG: 16S rRNA (cytosine(1402)-N(4))-methyltransferase [Candidatus Woesebacteria bacterium RBG_16_42_24]OGM16136.1 MAG: 16S rRNA (cytosine(1402)-N(4))-methyltransferase [Candidatus Woesebacteria bacterium RBG_19FT_COMBO_42_9]OGM67840.1 MAG: 16S rRNA (cytosine(1402)-N(4))-methyltransferase [Candidatus Woesebacteria bacterium RIFCSPLOWO2_01_FULL_43_11]
MGSLRNREKIHNPVLVREVLDFFAPLKNARIIDATVGTGGHTLALIKEGAEVLGIEADGQMLEVAARRLEDACPTPNQNGWGSFKLVKGNFRNIDIIATEIRYSDVDGVLFDLGVSNIQLTSPNRGFSFSNPQAELDMRIDPGSQGVRASDLLNGLRTDQLVSLFELTLKSGPAKWLAKGVIKSREQKPIKIVEDFLEVCKDLRTRSKLNKATLPFLALRMAVNSELANLKEALPEAFSLLKKGGRLSVITFHSGEKKIVLDFFHEKKREEKGKILTDGGISPTSKEVDENPRARSAELWVLVKS